MYPYSHAGAKGGTSVIRGAGIAVIAGCSNRRKRVAAYAVCTGARHMALIEGLANYRCPHADATGVTSVIRGARIVVIAGCSNRFR